MKPFKSFYWGFPNSFDENTIHHLLSAKFAIKKSMLFFSMEMQWRLQSFVIKSAITYVYYMERKLIGHIYIKCVNSRT